MTDYVECHDIDGNRVRVKKADLTFRPSAYGITIDADRVLLTRLKDGFDFPGGGVDLGEDLRDAVRREVAEETGIDVDVGDLLHATDDYFIHPVSLRPHHSLLYYYVCSNPRGEISMEKFDESDRALGTLMAEWVPLERIETIKFYNPVESVALITAASQNRMVQRP